MAGEQPVKFLSREHTRDLVALAEDARRGLARFAGHDKVTYDVQAMQLLDEWIDDTLEGRPHAPQEARLLWTSLLGEMFRRRHEGWWAFRDDWLVIVCPTSLGQRHVVPVEEQVDRRITFGMSESLAYFYNIARIELKLG
jgi:hypothetical protein